MVSTVLGGLASTVILREMLALPGSSCTDAPAPSTEHPLGPWPAVTREILLTSDNSEE